MALKVFLALMFILGIVLYLMALLITQPVLVNIGAVIVLISGIAAIVLSHKTEETTR